MTVEVELLKLGIPWSVIESADEERILVYWAIVTEQAKLEEDVAADRVSAQNARLAGRV